MEEWQGVCGEGSQGEREERGQEMELRVQSHLGRLSVLGRIASPHTHAPLEPQDIPLLGNKVFADVISGLYPMKVSFPEEERTDRGEAR